jgi:uncharacterized protein YecE (DUF72 family)
VAPFRVGCTGWGYDDWKGGFYPPGTPPGEYLAKYARAFRLTEVDSTYYEAPPRERVARWALDTPPGFTFCPKMLGRFTHHARLRVSEDALQDYLGLWQPLRVAEKLGPFLVELPPSFRGPEDATALEAFLDMLPRGTEAAVELRNAWWWRPETYAMLEARGIPLVWSYTEVGWSPPVRTADWLYVRLVGDRALTKFDRVQRDVSGPMTAMRDRLLAETARLRQAYVFVNNHLAGFAPASARLMAELLGADAPDISAAGRDEGQRGLMEF